MSKITSVRKWWAPEITLGFTLIAGLLAFGAVIGLAAPAAAATGYAYDVSTHMYDGAPHCAQAHTIEAAPVVSHDVAVSIQATAAAFTGPLAVFSLKSVAANTAPGLGSLSDAEARAWYLAQEQQIAARNAQMLEAGVSPELRAQIAFEARNAVRTQTRAAMADQEHAAQLDITDPNLTWEQIVQKYGGDYDAIADAASRSRPSVNEQFGLEP